MSELRIENGELRKPRKEGHSQFSILNSQFGGRPARHRRGFALYLLTISIAMLLAATALTLIAMQRAERHLQQNIADTGELNGYARAGLEMAVAFTEQVSTWRAHAVAHSGKLFENFPVGDGTVTAQVFDDIDGAIANSETQPVRLRVSASRGTARFHLEAQLRPRPHPALNYALFGTSATDMKLDTSVVIQGPVRAHGKIKAGTGDVVRDDVSFETMSGYTIESPFLPATFVTTAIAAPAPSLAVYEAMATVIWGDGGARCDLQEYILTPTANNEGTANAKGIYWLRAGNREVLISNLRLKGTLIITETGGNKVTFSNGLWVEPGADQYPVLLVDNATNFVDLSPSSTLSEWTFYLTVGWPACDLNGNSGWDLALPSQVRGVIWSNATKLYLRNSAWKFMGCAINQDITVDDGVVIDNDRTLLDTFSPGFVESGMSLLPGSVREVWP